MKNIWTDFQKYGQTLQIMDKGKHLVYLYLTDVKWVLIIRYCHYTKYITGSRYNIAVNCLLFLFFLVT